MLTVVQQFLLIWCTPKVQGSAESVVTDENRWNSFFYLKSISFLIM